MASLESAVEGVDSNLISPEVAEPKTPTFEVPRSQSFPIHKIYQAFQNYFRPRRKKAFMRHFPEVGRGASVLDVGGSVGWWKQDFPAALDVSIVNIDGDHRELVTRNGLKFFKADGRDLPFADKEFFLTFSNSVIEHVGDVDDQRRFASEMARCGTKLYLQTPNKWFPIEPHLMTVFIHWLPFKLSRRLIRYLSIWGLVAKPSQAQIDEFLKTTRLLSRSEIKSLFPDAQVTGEKVLGLTKSFIVIAK
jgi:2-polyprenyl-3-methyl-5-hydroxy-6-metoxy-1,4-benzoquinol methylase